MSATAPTLLRARSKPAILATVCVAVLAINLNTTIVNIALPTLSRELDASTRGLLWIVDAVGVRAADAVEGGEVLLVGVGKGVEVLLGRGDLGTHAVHDGLEVGASGEQPGGVGVA